MFSHNFYLMNFDNPMHDYHKRPTQSVSHKRQSSWELFPLYFLHSFTKLFLYRKSHTKIAQVGILLIFDKDINNINLVERLTDCTSQHIWNSASNSTRFLTPDFLLLVSTSFLPLAPLYGMTILFLSKINLFRTPSNQSKAFLFSSLFPLFIIC